MSLTNKNKRRAMYWIGGFLVVFFVIPNTTNFKERRAFSDRLRIEEAIALYTIDNTPDSVTLTAGKFYDRGKFFTLFMGEKQRELWRTPVTVKVFDYHKTKGGLTPYEIGGNQQTISLRLLDSAERKWVLRSVDKDQRLVLPGLLRASFLRFMVRDQLAAANPFGQLVIPVFAEAIGIHYNNPELFLVPYDSSFGEFNKVMAGRMAYLEEHLNSSWKDSEHYGSPIDIINTDDMLKHQEKEKVPLDSMRYLTNRLFDMLISDWDRHEGQWEWALQETKNGKIFEPVPKDRDNAFYKFDEGLFSHITLLFSKKFQSYRKDYGRVSGLMQQSQDLDRKILGTLRKDDFIKTAEHIQAALTDEVIREGFERYPAQVYKKVGKKHEDILKARLEKLPEVSLRFYELVQKTK